MVTKYLTYNEKVSIIYADTTNLCKYVEKLQNLTYCTSEIMGKFYTACSLMAFSDIKEESDEISVQLNGGGSAGLLYSILKLNENNIVIKGFIENSKIDFEAYNKNNDISKFIGNTGNLIVIKNNKYTKLGYKGITPLISGNIVNDFKSYYESSTQKPAFLGLEFIKDEFNFKSVGYLITFMPDCREKDILDIKNNIENNVDFKNMIKENKSIDEIVKKITGDNNIRKIENNLDIVYKCDCSKEKYRDMLATLKKTDLEDLLKLDENINIVCDYCNKSYDFSKEELINIINNL